MTLSFADVERMLVSLLEHELRWLRPGRTLPHPGEWTGFGRLDHPALSVDGLELGQLAGAVSEAFHLYETDADELLYRSMVLADWANVILTARVESGRHFSFRLATASGLPRLCMHEWAALEQEASEWAQLLPGRRRIVCQVPSHEIEGFLFAILVPQLMAIPVVETRLELGEVALAPGDLLVASPPQLAALHLTIPADVVVVSTGPVTTKLSRDLRAKKVASLMEVYGSSETGGLAYRYNSSEPFELLPYCRRDGDELVRRLPDGANLVVELADHIRWRDACAFQIVSPKTGSDEATAA